MTKREDLEYCEHVLKDQAQRAEAGIKLLQERGQRAQEILAEYRDALSLAEQREHVCKAALEQAQRAEARAADVEETLFTAVDDYLYDESLKEYSKDYCNQEKLPALRKAFLAMLSMPPSTLLDRLAEQEGQVADLKADLIHNVTMLAQQCDLARVAETETADLHGALQAALLPLEAAAVALVPEARVTEAAALVEEALVAIREELE